MKKVLSLLAISTVAANVFAADYKIDSGHTHARFAIDHFGTSTNHGGFYNLTGELKLDTKAETGFVDITIPVSSIDTSIEAFNQHLKSADLFHMEKYPTMHFVSDKWTFKDGKVATIEGKLTLLGKTNPVTLTATKFNCYNSPMFNNAEVCGGDFTATIDRTQWGMNYLVDMGMTKEVKLDIQLEAVKQ